MTEFQQVGPQQRRALLAALAAPGNAFRRVRGGWGANLPDGTTVQVTVRLIRAMSRDWLVDLTDEFAESAPLTRKGLALAQNLKATADAKPQSGAA